tara:strand:+ start:1518 stop:1874 length:357 start_codon:yes stop_codon:yes gene_type:complete
MKLNNPANIVKRAEATFDEFVRAVKIDLFTDVIVNTRVDTGRMRGNWQTTVGESTGSELDVTDKSGAKTINKMSRKVGGAGETTYLTNNVPYAGIWEQEDGMVAKSIARIDTIMRKNK